MSMKAKLRFLNMDPLEKQRITDTHKKNFVNAVPCDSGAGVASAGARSKVAIILVDDKGKTLCAFESQAAAAKAFSCSPKTIRRYLYEKPGVKFQKKGY